MRESVRWIGLSLLLVSPCTCAVLFDAARRETNEERKERWLMEQRAKEWSEPDPCEISSGEVLKARFPSLAALVQQHAAERKALRADRAARLRATAEARDTSDRIDSQRRTQRAVEDFEDEMVRLTMRHAKEKRSLCLSLRPASLGRRVRSGSR